jgi:hypothetical protein
MGNIVMNVALGRVASYASLPAASDGLVLVPLEASGLVADSTMRDYATLAALLAGATNEQTTIGRKALTNVTVTVNNTSDRVEVDADDVVYAAPAGNDLGAVVICYDPDTGTGDDTTIIPLTKHDYAITPEGDSLTISIADLFRATSTA